MKKFLSVLLATAFVVLLICGLFIRNYNNIVYMEVKGYDEPIVIELRPDAAPKTVANFKKLVSRGFYDGLIFHRVIENFMIQGGDPEGTGYGGSGKTIKGEFSANGVNNPLKHVRGTISMARGGYDMDSASSQFFIVHQTSENNSLSLDGQYAAFGQVISGMDVVDGIAISATDSKDKPIQTVTMGKVYMEKRIWTVNIVLLSVALPCLAGAVLFTLWVVKEEKAAAEAAAAAAAAAAARRRSHKSKRR